MTPHQRKLVYQFASQGTISQQEFLRQFPSTLSGAELACRQLEEAYERKIAEDVEYALMIGFKFGMSDPHKSILSKLFYADWHRSHEDIVFELDQMRDPAFVDLFYRATLFLPDYMDYDVDNRAMAKKAIWALANIHTPYAVDKLRSLSNSDVDAIRQTAVEQLDRVVAGDFFSPRGRR